MLRQWVCGAGSVQPLQNGLQLPVDLDAGHDLGHAARQENNLRGGCTAREICGSKKRKERQKRKEKEWGEKGGPSGGLDGGGSRGGHPGNDATPVHQMAEEVQDAAFPLPFWCRSKTNLFSVSFFFLLRFSPLF